MLHDAEKIDIVARIRDKCFIGLIPQEHVEEILEAADEIENLRYRISKIKKTITNSFREVYHA